MNEEENEIMTERDLWEEVLEMLNTSNKKIQIYNGAENIGTVEIETMEIARNSVLGVVVLYTEGIYIDNWIRVIGQRGKHHNGIIEYNSEQMNGNSDFLRGTVVVAQDIVGGIFAINKSRFSEGQKKIWYFAPDTLEWECLDMNYAEYMAWLLQGDTDMFYDSMRWKGWEKDCKDVGFDKSFLIYPFLWSKECDLSTATKKIVPYTELININFDYAKKWTLSQE
jgi:hypothetical protein